MRVPPGFADAVLQPILAVVHHGPLQTALLCRGRMLPIGAENDLAPSDFLAFAHGDDPLVPQGRVHELAIRVEPRSFDLVIEGAFLPSMTTHCFVPTFAT